MIRVLVVDDSALMRRHIGRLLEQSGRCQVETCATGEAALARAPEFAPDVVTLDVHMPGLDGLTTLARLMAIHPCAVLMVSAFTERGARTTLDALALGAVDYVTKPEGTISLHVEEWGPLLLEKVFTAAAAHVPAGPPHTAPFPATAPPRPATPLARRSSSPRPDGNGLVVMGASTGGPRALESILPVLPADFPWPIVLAQHMPAKFTRLFAERMDRQCPLRVMEVDSLKAVEPGCVYVAQGERDLRLSRRGGRLVAMPVPADPIYAWHPSVEALVESALDAQMPAVTIGVLLTGMGRDGAAAMTRLYRLGGRTIAESKDSAVVFGMPGELVAMGGANRTLPASRIAQQLLDWVGENGNRKEAAACP